MRKTFGHDARSYRHDAATLFNSLDGKFHFPLNQDTTKRTFEMVSYFFTGLASEAELVAHLEKRLGIKMGETTPDGKVTLRPAECLAACVGAPMMQVNKDYHEHLTEQKIDSIIESLD